MRGTNVYFWTTQIIPNEGRNLRHHELSDVFGRLVEVAECVNERCLTPDDIDARRTSYKYDYAGQMTDICMADGAGDCASAASANMNASMTA